jgi:putative PEP-CTERM system histidine kinase
VSGLLSALVPTLAALSSLLLAVAVVGRRRWGRVEAMFALGMLGFALEAAGVLLHTMAQRPEEAARWLNLVHGVALLVPVPWALFVIALGAVPAAWRWITAIGAGSALAAIAWSILLPPYHVVDGAGLGRVALLSTTGYYGVVLQLLTTVGVLGGLEACLRTANRDTRWRVKYLLLGLGGIFLVRFYFLSDALLFNVSRPEHQLAQTATVFVGNLVIAVSLVRGRLRGMEMTVSRHVLYRSIVVGAAGSYLFLVGALGWMLSWLGVPEMLFWGPLAVFVSALALAAVLLSDDVRWQVKRFFVRHFYRSKYDYRDQWTSFTKRLGSLLTLDELAPQLLAAVAEATGARKAALYLLDDRDGAYSMATTLGLEEPAPRLPADSPLLAAARTGRGPIILHDGSRHPWEGFHGPDGLTTFCDVAVVVPLAWQGRLVGIMLLGPERTGAPYGVEDVEFLATVSEQAAGRIVTASVSERLARSREFEAFHRLTSFIIHDVKNAVSALSLLTRNALHNFDDRDFQRDAITTLSRTVSRMEALLGRLSAPPDIHHLQFAPVDLGELAVATAMPLVDRSRVTLVRELEPVPNVRGDADALERVLQNLVTNAVEAMDGDGQLAIRTGLRDGMIACSMSDTGCGMPAEFIKRSLFVPFQSTKKGGWGIGLYQAREIVMALGGRIEVWSEEGRGATFTILLPPATHGVSEVGS